MNANGIITKIEEEIITLEQVEDAECASCTVEDKQKEKKGCSACGIMASSKKRYLRAVNSKKIDLVIGDRVEVYLPPGKAILGSLYIFIVPLTAFIGFFFLSGFIFPWFGDMEKALGGMIGIVLWYGMFFLINKVRKKKDWPIVNEKLN